MQHLSNDREKYEILKARLRQRIRLIRRALESRHGILNRNMQKNTAR
jgi:hypothetical protein